MTRRAGEDGDLNVDHPDKSRTSSPARPTGEEGLGAHRRRHFRGVQRPRGSVTTPFFFQTRTTRCGVTTSSCGRSCDGEWTTRAITTGKPMGPLPGRDLMRSCRSRDLRRSRDPVPTRPGTPGTRAQHGGSTPRILLRVHVPGRQRVQPRVAESHALPARDGEFDVEAFRAAVEIVITAMEILGGQRLLPDGADREELARIPAARPRLREPGALLMSRGLRTISDAGRAYAAAITA